MVHGFIRSYRYRRNKAKKLQLAKGKSNTLLFKSTISFIFILQSIFFYSLIIVIMFYWFIIINFSYTFVSTNFGGWLKEYLIDWQRTFVNESRTITRHKLRSLNEWVALLTVKGSINDKMLKRKFTTYKLWLFEQSSDFTKIHIEFNSTRSLTHVTIKNKIKIITF